MTDPSTVGATTWDLAFNWAISIGQKIPSLLESHDIIASRQGKDFYPGETCRLVPVGSPNDKFWMSVVKQGPCGTLGKTMLDA